MSLGYSACPHDCPSTCALEIELPGDNRIGRIHGAKANGYTAGVICEKVARYAERRHHPDRLLHPMRRKGEKGSGEFEPISWDAALDMLAEAMLKAELLHGPESVWPYHYAGTMGLLMRNGLNRLRHVKGYSGQDYTICSTLPYTGFKAGTGKMMGPDPREMAKADVVVIWGTNPVHTQVNVMTHAMAARKERGAKIVVVDVYHTPTMAQADMALCLRPGTDGALAVAVMHVLFRDGFADRDYLARYTDCPDDLERHVKDRSPAWASAITGLTEAEIEGFARLLGEHPRSFFRLGFGFARQRNGATNMHAVTAIAAVLGAWQHEGGGALMGNSGIYGLDKTLIEGLDARNPEVRMLDMSQIGRILTGDKEALKGGPPVSVLFTQNTNPAAVAPEQTKVRAGLMRSDLFTCVHEQFLTETARLADLVLPATMFMEHDDIYVGGGHTFLLAGPKLVDPPGECRNNHEVLRDLARYLVAPHAGFTMSETEILDATLKASGYGSYEALKQARWIDCAPDFRTAHYLDGFAHDDGKFHFRPDWRALADPNPGPRGPVETMPALPDHWAVLEEPDDTHPFRLVTAPARRFLNTTFTETPTSREKEGRPTVRIHPEDAAAHGIGDGDPVCLENARGKVRLWAQHFPGVQRGVLVVETIFPNESFPGGVGINALTSADTAAPVGGAVFHDGTVRIRRDETA